jgi:site-specific DNA-adenine methylase
MELTNKEKQMLWNMCNSIQNKGIKFLMDYETGLFHQSKELEIWYNETKKEFKELQSLKDKLESKEE